MGFLGEKAAFKFGTTTYYCLRRASGSGRAVEVESKCSSETGVVKEYIDDLPTNEHSFDVLVASQGHAMMAALAEGTENAAFEVYPEGVASGNIKISYADGGKVLSQDWDATVDGEFVMSLTIRGNGAKTIAGASA